MTREEFNKLSPAMQLKVLARVFFEREALGDINVGKRPLPPKFDMRIFRSGGLYQWASEMSLDSLQFWHGKAVESAKRGGPWAGKDAKRAKDLERWLVWREWFPTEQWQGERNHHDVTGAPPADRPRTYSSEPREGGQHQQRQNGASQQGEAPPPEDDEDDVAFA